MHGSPAVLKETKAIEDLPQPLEITPRDRKLYMFAFSLSVLLFPFVILLPLLPVIITVNTMDNNADDWDFSYLVTIPVLATVYIILFALETAVLTRLLQWGMKPGKYPVYSRFYMRKWFADQLLSLNLVVLHPIYATVFLPAFLGPLVQRSARTPRCPPPVTLPTPMLTIGDGSFIADAVTLGESDIRGLQLILDNTVIGSSSFVGNSALIPAGL